MRLPGFIAISALALGACSQGENNPTDTTTETVAAEDGATAQIGTPPPPAGQDDAAAASDNGFASSYTTLDLERCQVLDQSDGEGSWIRLRCPGFRGVPLLVIEGDGRFDIDAGVENEGFATIGAFNDVADKVEWRTRDGRPFAIIFRYRDVTIKLNGRSVLAVEKIGRRGAPGCRVAQIAGDTPSANQRAREIADRSAAGFDCSREPQFIGDAR